MKDVGSQSLHPFLMRKYGPYIWNEEKVIYHYHIWKTKLVSDMDKMFSYYYLQALTESIKSQTHETTMGFVTMGIMNNSYIAYPRNIKEQKKISCVCCLRESVYLCLSRIW